MLRDALAQLMQRHRWDRINVRQICDEADIARSTFYVHFDNKQQLLDYCFAMLQSELQEQHPGRGLSIHQTFGFLPGLLDHVKSHREIFRINASSATGFAIFTRFRRVIDVFVENEVKRSEFANRLASDQTTFVSGGIFAVLERWSRDGCAEPVQIVLLRIDGLIAGIMGGPHETG